MPTNKKVGKGQVTIQPVGPPYGVAGGFRRRQRPPSPGGVFGDPPPSGGATGGPSWGRGGRRAAGGVGSAMSIAPSAPASDDSGGFSTVTKTGGGGGDSDPVKSPFGEGQGRMKAGKGKAVGCGHAACKVGKGCSVGKGQSKRVGKGADAMGGAWQDQQDKPDDSSPYDYGKGSRDTNSYDKATGTPNANQRDDWRFQRQKGVGEGQAKKKRVGKGQGPMDPMLGGGGPQSLPMQGPPPTMGAGPGMLPPLDPSMDAQMKTLKSRLGAAPPRPGKPSPTSRVAGGKIKGPPLGVRRAPARAPGKSSPGGL